MKALRPDLIEGNQEKEEEKNETMKNKEGLKGQY